MSDTCWLEMTFRRRDLPKLNATLEHRMCDGTFWNEEDSDEKEIIASIYEADYGWYDEIHALAKAGVTFTASSGPGSNYGPSIYACYKGKLIECNTDINETPVAQVTEKGLNEDALNNCMEYFKVLRKILTDSKGKEAQDGLDISS